MSRDARNKEKSLPHHIICKGMEEIRLYNNDKDKKFYLNLMHEAALIFNIEIICYCIMDTHVHMIVHPRGADISKFMGTINNSYAKYYNRVYKRRGHVFAERFKNKVIDDLDYLLKATIYVHNNAKDLKHCNNILEYAYSSINDYINPSKGYGIASPNYVFEIIGIERSEARKYYMTLLKIKNTGIKAYQYKDFKENPMNMRCKKTYERNMDPIYVIKSIQKYFCNSDKKTNVKIKNISEEMIKGITTIALRMFCDLNLKEVGLKLGNQSYSSLYNLSKIGLKFMKNEPNFLMGLLT